MAQTKAELVERARRLGVDGADDLKMDELRDAIGRAETRPALVLGDEGRRVSRNSREPQHIGGVPGLYGSGRAVDLAEAAAEQGVDPETLVERVEGTPLQVEQVSPSQIRSRPLGDLAAKRERGLAPGATVPLPETGTHLPSEAAGVVVEPGPPVSEAAEDAAREVVSEELERREAEELAAAEAAASSEESD